MATLAQGRENRARTYEMVVRYISENGWAPSYSEIMKATGVASKSTILDHLLYLEREGKLRLGRESKSPGATARKIALVPDARTRMAAAALARLEKEKP